MISSYFQQFQKHSNVLCKFLNPMDVLQKLLKKKILIKNKKQNSQNC